MQTLNFNLDLQSRIVGKCLTLPKHEGIILNSMTQTTRGKWDFLVLSRADF